MRVECPSGFSGRGRALSLLILALTVTGPLAEAAESASSSRAGCRAPEAALQQAIREVHEKQRNVGVAAVIRRDGRDVFEVYIGLADLENDVSVSAASRFGIASITKLYTASTLLRLHERDLIDLDAPVQKYVPQFPVKPQGEITIRMLATHRSGIPHPRDRTPKLFATHYTSAMDALEVFAGADLLFPPGTKAAYSSSNYNLIAAVIEGATGANFQEVVRREVLDPLSLHETGFDDTLRPLAHRVRRYSYYHPWTYAESDTLYVVPTWDYSFNMGGGNLNATAKDVAAFGEALLSPGLLLPESMETLESWFGSGSEEGGREIFASGANPGVQAGLSIRLDQKVVAVVLSNTWGIGSRSAEMTKLASRLSAMCAGVEGRGAPD